MKFVFNLLFFVACSTAIHGQVTSNSISGIVKDSSNATIAGATVQLLNATDTSTVSVSMTSEAGKFFFSNLPYGIYQLLITATGQKKFSSATINIDSGHSNISLPVVVLLPLTNTALAEVVIKARRPLLIQEIDKTVVNVASMISSAGSNTLEILEKTPGVTVSASGEISLNGRGSVLVLVDGRSTYMSGTDLAAYLKSLPAGLLEKIELMDNPPARYDAAGNAIINIKLKKNKVGGFTGNVSLGYTQGQYARSNNALNLNYNYKKINLFGNIGFSYDKNYSLDVYNRKFYNGANEPVSGVLLANNQHARSHGVNALVGADYIASPNSTLGFLVNLSSNSRRGSFDYNSENYTLKALPDSTGTGGTRTTEKKHNLGTNINYTHKFGSTGKELTADANYLHYESNGHQDLLNYVFDPGHLLLSNSSFLYLQPSAISIYTLKADYAQPISKHIRVEGGGKSSFVDNDNLTDYYNTTGTTPTIDNSQSNHFLYHENINAAYLNTQAKWARFGAQLGLRVENTRSSGRQLGNDSVKVSRFAKNYTQLFPSIYLSYKLDTVGKNSLTLSLTRRINRPNYQLLNPFIFMRDQYSYTAGNPLLSPQYQYRYELRYQHKQFLRMGLSYNRFTDIIFQTTNVVEQVFITRPENIAKGYMLLLNTGLSLSPAKSWNLNTDILLSRIGLQGKAYNVPLTPSTYVARINIINQFQWNKGWSAEAGGYYASRDLNGQAYTSGMFRVNAAIQKKVWKERGTVRLNFEDIFHSWIYHNRSVDLKQAQFLQTGESDTQRIGFAFTYRFGRSGFARKSKHNDNASDDEKGRVE